MADEPSEFVDTMRRTAASMDGIDNSWNLLHIASQVMAALAVNAERAAGHPIDRDDEYYVRCAQGSLKYADALLKEWRKSQGDDYGD